MQLALWAALALLSQDEQARKIDQCIRDLGSEYYETREKAMIELRKIGKAALPALRKAAEGAEDPEVRLRAKQLVEEIEKAEKKPPMKRTASRISVQSSGGDTVYVITPGEGDPITFKRLKDGSVELEYVEDGTKRTAKSESLEKFLEEHRELARKYGISREGIRYAGVRASFQGGRSEFRFQEPDAEEFWRQFEEEMERLRRQLREFGFEDEEWPRSTYRRDTVYGASFDPVDEVLRSHLEIPEGTGLVVRRVKEGTLAAEVGLKKHDIVLEVDGVKIATSRDLRGLKRESKVTVLRAGKRVELKKE